MYVRVRYRFFKNATEETRELYVCMYACMYVCMYVYTEREREKERLRESCGGSTAVSAYLRTYATHVLIEAAQHYTPNARMTG